MFRNVHRVMPSVVALVALVACQAESASVNAVNVTEAGEAKRQVIRSAGKVAPPINVGYKLLGEPEIGEPLEIELSVSSELPGATFSVSLQPRDDLLLGTGQDSAMEVSRATIGTDRDFGTELMSRRVSVIPQSEGRSYLVVTVSTPTEEGSASRVLAVPIQVGDLPPRMHINGKVTGEGDEAVVSMPGKQTEE